MRKLLFVLVIAAVLLTGGCALVDWLAEPLLPSDPDAPITETLADRIEILADKAAAGTARWSVLADRWLEVLASLGVGGGTIALWKKVKDKQRDKILVATEKAKDSAVLVNETLVESIDLLRDTAKAGESTLNELLDLLGKKATGETKVEIEKIRKGVN